jgi:hypothetical protein
MRRRIAIHRSRRRAAGLLDAILGQRNTQLTSNLFCRQAHNQTVKLVRDFDLAGKAAVRLLIDNVLDQPLLHRAPLANLVEPDRVDIHVTGRALAGAAALPDDSPHFIPDRALHYGKPGRYIKHVLRAAEFDIGNFCHTILYIPPAAL